jgi:hypothetical protein
MELEILNKNVGGLTIKEMTAITFFTWVARKLNDVKAYDVRVVELTRLVTSPIGSRTLPDDYKLEIIAKLKSLNIEI